MRFFRRRGPAWFGIEHAARVHRVELLLGADAPRHGEQPVEVRADDRRLGARLAHALEAPELALGLRADRLRHTGLADLPPVLVADGALVLAELLPDRVHLAAEEVLALLLLRAGLDVLADALANLHLSQAVALQRQRLRQPLDHVELPQQLDLLPERDLGRVAACRRARRPR